MITFKKIKAQSIFDYSLLAMLVIVGAIIMLPHMVNSISGHFKLWQEAQEDSVNDRMIKIPLNITVPSCTCDANKPIYGGCGGAFQRSPQSCSASQHYWYSSCGPDPSCGYGTGFTEGCVNDPVAGQTNCCDIYNACSLSGPLASCCGSSPIPANASGNLNQPRTTSDPNGLDPVVTNPTNPRDSCYYGEELLYNQCDTTKIRCKPRADGQCNAACTGTLPLDTNGTPTAVACPGSDQSLTKNWPIVLVDGQNCTNAPKCSYKCKDGYVEQGTTGNLTCIPCALNSHCRPFQVNSGNNSWGSFMQKYAMWLAPADDTHVFGGIPTTYTRRIGINTTGVYTLHFAVNNQGDVDIDGKTVCSSNGNVTNNNLYSECTVTLSRGGHSVTLTATNSSISGSTWAQNSAGVALEIGTGTGTHFTPLSSPSINTGVSQLSLWKANLTCPSSQIWNCNTFSCATIIPSASDCIAPTAKDCNLTTNNQGIINGGNYSTCCDSYKPNTQNKKTNCLFNPQDGIVNNNTQQITYVNTSNSGIWFGDGNDWTTADKLCQLKGCNVATGVHSSGFEDCGNGNMYIWNGTQWNYKNACNDSGNNLDIILCDCS